MVVFWETDLRWFTGTVREYDACSDKHLVVYDDGDQRREDFDDPRLKWEVYEPKSEPKSKAAGEEPGLDQKQKEGTIGIAKKQPVAWVQREKVAREQVGADAKAALHRVEQAAFRRVILRCRGIDDGGDPGEAVVGVANGRAAGKSDARVVVKEDEKSERKAKGKAGGNTSKTSGPQDGPVHLWPGGGNWRPGTHDWGMRSCTAFGCGKCRWSALGCRGCIAAAQSYTSPTPPLLPAGKVSLPSFRLHAHCYAHTDGPDEAGRVASLRQLESSVRVVGGPEQIDVAGFGVVAVRCLRPGENLLDWSVFFVSRPASYALAHLPQYHALEFGKSAYFQLREPTLGHVSLTYFVNEANHCGATGAAANVAYKVLRPRDGGVALGLHVLKPIEKGEELLAKYDQRLN